MLLSKHALIKVGSNNASYWRSLGYDVPKVGGKGGMNGIHQLRVDVHDLQKQSNVTVSCKCDECGTKYVQRWSRNKDRCEPCRVKERMKKQKYGQANKGKKLPHMTGENSPRWNPNKTAFRSYSNRVRGLSEVTYRENIETLNPLRHPRTLCGVEGGYQLDHIVSVKKGFIDGTPPEDLARLENLQLLPWKDNSLKRRTDGVERKTASHGFV